MVFLSSFRHIAGQYLEYTITASFRILSNSSPINKSSCHSKLYISLCRRWQRLKIFLRKKNLSIYLLLSFLVSLFFFLHLYFFISLLLSQSLYFSLPPFLPHVYLSVACLLSITLSPRDDRRPSQGKPGILLWWRITEKPTCSSRTTAHKLVENINIHGGTGGDLASWVLNSIHLPVPQGDVTSEGTCCL
jgi:hypothetical protein